MLRSVVDLKVIMVVLRVWDIKKPTERDCRVGGMKWALGQVERDDLWRFRQIEAVEMSSYLGEFSISPGGNRGRNRGHIPACLPRIGRIWEAQAGAQGGTLEFRGGNSSKLNSNRNTRGGLGRNAVNAIHEIDLV